MTRFDPKDFKGQEVLRKIRGETAISQLFIWDKSRKRYDSPMHRKCYRFKQRLRDDFGAKVDVIRWFQTLSEARAFAQTRHVLRGQAEQALAAFDGLTSTGDTPQGCDSPTLQDVRDHWLTVVGTTLTENTLVNHRRYWSNHLWKLGQIPVRDITPRTVDDWIQWMKTEVTCGHQAKARKAFLHELKALTALLNHYGENWDDLEFRSPIKKRHRQAVVVRRQIKEADKDLTLEGFRRFSEELRRGSGGMLLWALAQVQFFHCLRISEVAALKWEDIDLRFQEPSESKLIIRRHVIYHRGANKEPTLAPGFKNSSEAHPTKGSHLTPESYAALREVWHLGAKGLVFHQEGEILPERYISSRFNRAFQRAGLPYTGTHILRHGGTRFVLNSTGDLSIAQQALGNRDMKSTLVYAQRDKQALNGLFKQRWREHENSLTSQSEVVGGREHNGTVN